MSLRLISLAALLSLSLALSSLLGLIQNQGQPENSVESEVAPAVEQPVVIARVVAEQAVESVLVFGPVGFELVVPEQFAEAD